MITLFSHPLRLGLMAVGFASCLAAPVLAGPVSMPAMETSSDGLVLIRQGDDSHPQQWWRRYQGNRDHGNDRWNRRDHWNNNNNNWRRDHWGNRDNSWRYRRHYRDNSGFYFGLGVLPSYNYYVAPRYAPPRYYRSAGSAHVRWCYSRYRSYRAWDNTFQPNYGPRRQCRSPYD